MATERILMYAYQKHTLLIVFFLRVFLGLIGTFLPGQQPIDLLFVIFNSWRNFNAHGMHTGLLSLLPLSEEVRHSIHYHRITGKNTYINNSEMDIITSDLFHCQPRYYRESHQANSHDCWLSVINTRKIWPQILA